MPLVALAVLLVGCGRAKAVSPVAVASPTAQATPAPVSVVAATPAVATPDALPTNPPEPTAAQPAPPPVDASATCGVVLSPLPPVQIAPTTRLDVSDDAREALRAQVPAAAWPALVRLLDTPGAVGLAAYQMGRESEGVYLNDSTPMPLASVAKTLVLVAYAEALAAGELNPLERVTLAELERYYLTNFDLGAHRRAVAELRENGEILDAGGDNEAVTLEDVAWMMIRHSSNAASDYLQLRLGQERIERTAVALGLNDAPDVHSAPCVFLGQFLMMANHQRGVVNDRALLATYTGDAARAAEFGRQLSALAAAYIEQADFRAAEQAWRGGNRRVSIDTQRYFTANLAPQGTAAAYARLMMRLAQNGLSNADSSYQARRILEWTNQFPANQEWFSNIGYKNGSLPGVLTTAYYAYRWGDLAPVVVVLFYRDLPQETYRQWRFDLPHDELARWLLADPQAIPTLSAVLRGAAAP